MNLIGIVMVRNEADIVRLSLLHHLSQGLDRVLVIDNGSTDGTAEILARVSQDDPRVQWRSDPGPYMQSVALTELAREAFRLGADWVVPFDADEFWWVKLGNLRTKLESTTAGALRAPVINFVQHRDQYLPTEVGLLTMTRRPPRPVDANQAWVESGQVGFIELRYPAKWIFRPTAETVVEAGNHAVSAVAGMWAESSGLACLHAPLRSRACLERKAEYGVRALQSGSPPEFSWHLKRWARMREAGELDRDWAANSYSGTSLDVSGRERPLDADYRLRDVIVPLLDQASIPADSNNGSVKLAAAPRAARGQRRVGRTPVEHQPARPAPASAERWHPRRLLVESANEGTLAFLKSTSSRVIAEVGVYEGHTSKEIAEFLNGEGELHLFDFSDRVDAVVAELEEAGFRNVIGYGNSRKLLDSYNWSLMRLLQKHDTPIFDYVFLDGGHVWALDALAFLLLDRLLKPGGYIDFDDYHWSLAISPALNPSAFPMTAELYTDEQIAERQVALVVDLLVRRDRRYVEVVQNKIFRKEAPEPGAS
jgi:predicted O-methyltransferase YrrM